MTYLNSNLNLNDALADLLKAIDLNFEKKSNAYSWCGYIHMQLNNPSSAVECYKKAVETGGWAEDHVALAKAYIQLGDPLKAAESYLNAALCYSGWFQPGYGKKFDELANITQVIALTSKAIALNPQLAEAYAQRGKAYQLQYHLALGGKCGFTPSFLSSNYLDHANKDFKKAKSFSDALALNNKKEESFIKPS